MSLLAEIEATCLILSNEFPTWVDCLFKSLTIALTALSIPLFKSIGLAPAATFFNPSFTIAWAKTVAVVVPSPAKSFVFEATSLTIWAPIFSSSLSSSTSFATVTPSFVTWGGPNDLLIITFLPFGPKVTLTALANASTPFFKPSLASTSNFISFAILFIFIVKQLPEYHFLTLLNNLFRPVLIQFQHTFRTRLFHRL